MDFDIKWVWWVCNALLANRVLRTRVQKHGYLRFTDRIGSPWLTEKWGSMGAMILSKPSKHSKAW